jgi:hypothetical protein
MNNSYENRLVVLLGRIAVAQGTACCAATCIFSSFMVTLVSGMEDFFECVLSACDNTLRLNRVGLYEIIKNAK